MTMTTQPGTGEFQIPSSPENKKGGLRGLFDRLLGRKAATSQVEVASFKPPVKTITDVQVRPEVDPRTGIIAPFGEGSGDTPSPVDSAQANQLRPVFIQEVPQDIAAGAEAAQARVNAEAAARHAASQEIAAQVQPAPESPESTNS